MKTRNATQQVNAQLCLDAGVQSPEAERKCGGGDCPRWTVTEWTPCETSKCFNWNTGRSNLQKFVNQQKLTWICVFRYAEEERNLRGQPERDAELFEM